MWRGCLTTALRRRGRAGRGEGFRESSAWDGAGGILRGGGGCNVGLGRS